MTATFEFVPLRVRSLSRGFRAPPATPAKWVDPPPPANRFLPDIMPTTSPQFAPLAQLAEALRAGRTTSRDLVEQALERIEDPSGQGAIAFVHVDAARARAAADAHDALRRAGTVLSPLAGIPVSIKDLFDIEGQITRAGSRVLADALPATADAIPVARLRRAGAVFVGRTNMSE